MNRKLTRFFNILALSVATAVASGCADIRAPKDEGREWLEKKGYTNVTGGERDYWNSCGKNTYARGYDCTDKDGKRVHKTVCFGLFGKHSPLFGD